MTSRWGVLATALVLAPWSAAAAQTDHHRPGDRAKSTTARISSTKKNLGTAVVEAAARGDLAAVKSMIAQGADVTVSPGDGMTALHWAADRGDAAMAAALLRAGAKLDAKTSVNGYTPLHVASRSGSAAVVKALLDAGANARTMTGTGATAMHLAAASGNAESVSALIAKKGDVNARETAWGQTPLMFAATENRADVIKVLVKAGADPKVATRSMDLTEELARQQAAAKRRNEDLDGSAAGEAARFHQGGAGQGGSGSRGRRCASHPKSRLVRPRVRQRVHKPRRPRRHARRQHRRAQHRQALSRSSTRRGAETGPGRRRVPRGCGGAANLDADAHADSECDSRRTRDVQCADAGQDHVDRSR